jgi:hypothetical protein
MMFSLTVSIDFPINALCHAKLKLGGMSQFEPIKVQSHLLAPMQLWNATHAMDVQSMLKTR